MRTLERASCKYVLTITTESHAPLTSLEVKHCISANVVQKIVIDDELDDTYGRPSAAKIPYMYVLTHQNILPIQLRNLSI